MGVVGGRGSGSISVGSVASTYVIVFTRIFYSTPYMYLIFYVGGTAIIF